jgi:membrane-associated phospholipid phosphatase
MNLSFRPQSRRQLIVWLAALILLLTAVLLFLELAEDVWLNEGFQWDATLILGIHSLSQPWLDKFFWLVTQTAGPFIVVLVGITAVWFWWHGERTIALLFIVSFVGTFLLNSLLKIIFSRPRPDLFPPIVVEHSYSFPSGHTMSAIAYYGLLALVLWQRGRRGWAVLAGLWVPSVAFSRVYLGAHYPSDVLASLAIGTIWLVIVWFVYTGHHIDHMDTAQQT